ncbi:EGT [Choristoneura occidentalis granulovirus]|uniref:Ecdysteroid UDP-glucosyltransferase n=2 Tax=Betabaculovirus chofumiferanae TaxID=3051997 RepID=Q999Y7_GVCF|nr:EGT [Choristoneura fumiferana granulovirus]AAG50437.1 ecdysteroid UDP-glucosyltransferase [Choristoneura fumiferana granulovirus]ABC61249.1 EGT [Choristoneura fumiferana granulovirus]
MFVQLILVVLAPCFVCSSNILCVFPTPALSHQSVFAAYVDKLVIAGHNVTVITPMPRGVQHVTEIDCSTKNVFVNLVKNSTSLKKRGLVADELTVTAENYTPIIDMVVEQIKSYNVTNLLKNKDNNFDLVVCEAYLDIILIFGHLYRTPIIKFSSGYGTNENFKTMNADVKYNSVVYPNLWRSNFSNENIEQALNTEWQKLKQIQNIRLQKLFGDRTSTISVMQQSVKLLFVNVPHVFDSDRPVGENVQYLGGIHLKKPRPVRDIKLIEFLNQKTNIIYVSFGSILDAAAMDESLLTEFVKVFTKFNVLWKIDNVVSSKFNLSDNILTRNWFPQRDILNHPNVKLFITQGGVQSVDEAVDSEIPLICIPMVGDQFVNCRRIDQLNIGVVVNILKLESENLYKKINDVMNDTTIVDKIHALKKNIHDAPMKPLHKALWYTQKVLRNNKY